LTNEQGAFARDGQYVGDIFNRLSESALGLETGSRVGTKHQKSPAYPRDPIRGAIHGYGGCRIEYIESPDKDFIKEAAEVTASADVSLDVEWELGGYDRQTIYLPKDGE